MEKLSFSPKQFSEKNTKSAIIEVLSQKWPLTAKEIYSLTKKVSSTNVSYQAVHKTINELVTQEVINKNERKYSLNLEWIKKLKEFGTKLEEKYLRKKIENNQQTSITIHCLWDLYLFVLGSFVENRFETGKKSICFQSEYVWIPPIGTEKEWILLKEFLKDHTLLVLIKSRTHIDEMLKKGWENTGMLYKLGIETETSRLMKDIFIIGDYVVQTHFPEEFIEKAKIVYKNIGSTEEINFNEIQDFFYYRYKEGIQILIQKNKVLADRLRKMTEREFKEELDTQTKDKIKK